MPTTGATSLIGKVRSESRYLDRSRLDTGVRGWIVVVGVSAIASS